MWMLTSHKFWSFGGKNDAHDCVVLIIKYCVGKQCTSNNKPARNNSPQTKYSWTLIHDYIMYFFSL